MSTAVPVYAKFVIVDAQSLRGPRGFAYRELMEFLATVPPGKGLQIDVHDYGTTIGGVNQTLRAYAKKAGMDVSVFKVSESTLIVSRRF